MVSTELLLQMIMPFVTYMLYGLVFLAIVIPGGYYFIIIRNRRKWYANIWEKRGDFAIIVDKDVVNEKRIKGKNHHAYMLRKKRYSVQPIKEENIITYKGKSYIDYLRVGSDYVPFTHNFKFDKAEASLEYETMPYDVAMQMIATEKLIDETFKLDADFWGKYGQLIGLALVVVLMIVLMSMYYDFVTSSLEPVKETGNALLKISNQVVGS